MLSVVSDVGLKVPHRTGILKTITLMRRLETKQKEEKRRTRIAGFVRNGPGKIKINKKIKAAFVMTIFISGPVPEAVPFQTAPSSPGVFRMRFINQPLL